MTTLVCTVPTQNPTPEPTPSPTSQPTINPPLLYYVLYSVSDYSYDSAPYQTDVYVLNACSNTSSGQSTRYTSDHSNVNYYYLYKTYYFEPNCQGDSYSDYILSSYSYRDYYYSSYAMITADYLIDENSNIIL